MIKISGIDVLQNFHPTLGQNEGPGVDKRDRSV
jgi:hypothetical protein